MDLEKHNKMANAIRMLAVDAVEAANSGHPGLPMGAADIATVLFARHAVFDPSDPNWPDRDRFVLSAGHGSMLLYAVLYLLGYEDFTIDELKRFRQLGSRTEGHPEVGKGRGIETTTGPLGQGLANAVGMALAERMLNADFGDGLVDHHTYVLASDGDLMEGISHEAISIAGHLGLGRLIVIFDDNGITIDGATDLAESGDVVERFAAAGWDAVRIDGHDPVAIDDALAAARAATDRPSLIAAKTVIGFGSPGKGGTAKAHGSPLGAAEVRAVRAELGWEAAPFEVTADARDAWRIAGLRSGQARKDWQRRLEAAPPETRASFERRLRRELPLSFASHMAGLRGTLHAERPALATRKASERALETVTAAVPEMVGGSADLTGSNNTRAGGMAPLAASDYAGRYIHWGVREHGMAAAMNGIALAGGFIPFGGTFLVFSDYARPAIRLAALMKLGVIYVLTHDSIGLGEDGATHQPVEHLASLRAMPGLTVIRPADAIETADAWEIAVERRGGPTALALTRQTLECVTAGEAGENRVRRGAYVLAGAGAEPMVTVFASGSEVALALKAREIMAGSGVVSRVVSVPSFELFEQQDRDYREAVIGEAPVKVAVEAAVRQGWDRFIGADGVFVGMDVFGASAPGPELYRHFGITAEAVAERAMAALSAAGLGPGTAEAAAAGG